MATAAVHGTVANQQLTLRQQLESDSFRSQIAKVLPKHLKPERMIRVAVTALTRTPKLRECDQASFFLAMLNLSQWGLEPDGRRAHLIPFENKKRGCTEVQLIIDYKGLVELAMRSGEISHIHADVVCDNDEFEYDRGELKRHKIDFKNPRGRVYAVYCLVRMKDGSEKCEVMNREEVESVRARSRAGKAGPWVTDWNEMAKKTVFRRVSKWLPLSAEVQDAVASDDDVIDTTATPSRQSPSLDDLADRLIGVGDSDDAEQRDDPEPAPEPTPEPGATEFDHLFAHCTTKTAVKETMNDLLANDPGIDAGLLGLAAQRAEERITATRGANSNK